MRKTALTVLLLAAICNAFLSSEPTGNAPIRAPRTKAKLTDDYYICVDVNTGLARWAFPRKTLRFEPNSMIEDALRFVDENENLFGIKSGELRLLSQTKRLGKYWLNFQQTYLGIPVIDGIIYFRILEDGHVWGFGSKAVKNFFPKDATPSIDAYEACEIASKKIKYAVSHDYTYQPKLVWFPINNTAHLSWQVQVTGEEPNKFIAFIDAINGNLLAYWNLTNYFDLSGTVRIWYLPDFADDSFSTDYFKHGRVVFNYLQMTTTNDSGYYYINAWLGHHPFLFMSWLRGLWVDVIKMDGGGAELDTLIAPPTNFSWTWTTEMAEPDELNLYYHTDYIHKYFKRLDPDFCGLDYPVPARARHPRMPTNAFWDGYGINFGAGNRDYHNFALFSAVIYHEYTHGVTMHIYEHHYFPYAGQSGAMNEAFSDYFALTNRGYPYMGWKVRRGGGWFRNLENNLVFPRDTIGEPHYDSRIISAAFWEIRKGVLPVGRVGWADTIIHFTRYSGANTFDDFAIETFFTADDDGNPSNGCPNFALIANSYARHGIGQGYYPYFYAYIDSISSTGDSTFYEPAETVTIHYSIVYDHFHSRVSGFPYPPAESVLIKFTTRDTDITFIDSAAFFSSIEYHDTVHVQFRFVIDTDIVSHYAKFKLNIPSGYLCPWHNGEITIPLGRPQMLLVGACPPAEAQNLYEYYYAPAYRQFLGVVGFCVATDSTPTYEQMKRFPVVLWYTGEAESSLSARNIAELSTYMDSGGGVILTGQDGFDNPDYSSWLSEYFGARVDSTNIRAIRVLGIAGDPLGDSFDVVLIGGSGANNQRSPSTLTPTTGTPFQRYDSPGNPIAAVRFTNSTHKSVILGYGLEATAGGIMSITLADALRKLLHWFGIPTYDEVSEPRVYAKPEKPLINAYPNPFNKAVTISIKSKEEFELMIYDLNGKIVHQKRGMHNRGNTNFVWKPSGLPSGVYFIVVKTDNTISTAKILLLR